MAAAGFLLEAESKRAYFFFFPFFSLSFFFSVFFFTFAAVPASIRRRGQSLQYRPDLRYLRQHFFLVLSFFFPKAYEPAGEYSCRFFPHPALSRGERGAIAALPEGERAGAGWEGQSSDYFFAAWSISWPRPLPRARPSRPAQPWRRAAPCLPRPAFRCSAAPHQKSAWSPAR